MSDKAACFDLQLVELKEAEETSLKESERLEKEIVEVQEMKVTQKQRFCRICFFTFSLSIVFALISL